MITDPKTSANDQCCCHASPRSIPADAIRIHVLHPRPDECYFVACVNQPVADSREAASLIYQRMLEVLGLEGWHIVHERIFGSVCVRESVLAGRDEILRPKGLHSTPPHTYVEGRPLWGEGLAGIQIRALRLPNPRDSWEITEDNVSWGRAWRHRGAIYILLQNLHGLPMPGKRPGTTVGAYEQTLRLFDGANPAIRAARRHGNPG